MLLARRRIGPLLTFRYRHRCVLEATCETTPGGQKKRVRFSSTVVEIAVHGR
ncbi:hypothetical protein [Natronorubrum sediminis]|uniref:hypothetical protein n=1 Tax=Natronorubrum sediminis TaxID=640943 RepID=UPI0015879AD1|nr:hypothetical protein [Natronorubrum sediminis]